MQDEIEFGSGGVLTVTADGGSLGVGYRGAGGLMVADGVTVNTLRGYLGYFAGSTGQATVTGNNSLWSNSGNLHVGRSGNGTLRIQAGGRVTNATGYLGHENGSMGVAMVAGDGSRWSSSGDLLVGFIGSGGLTILAGGTVTNATGYLGFAPNSAGEAMVTGIGSHWKNSGDLLVGFLDSGELTISHRAIVSVAGALTVDSVSTGEGFVNMATAGMLALKSEATGDDSLADFLALVGGTKAIRYWDDALADWADISSATYGDDYTLEYLTSGDLAGYTLLTVGQLPALAGDYNDDGVVDAADYSVWRDNLGQSVTLPNQATPGSVTEHGREVWAANYGATLVSGAIPEPNALALAALALGGVAVGRRS
jgi:T5SS/PEP-CTERM-associated repeat protein